MNVGVFGLGYVGCVTAACLAEIGHGVIGVDVNEVKVNSINAGRSPIVEANIDKLIEVAVKSGRLRATMSTEEAIATSDISLICVGTPSNGNGSLDLRYIKACCQQIGRALRGHPRFHIVAVRSTVLPGSISGMVMPIVEEFSQKTASVDFGLCSNPEFLREGTSVQDFLNPPYTLIGSSDQQVACVMVRLYDHIKAPLIQTSIEVAEIVKYVNNTFHALKVCFANEVGNICKALGIDSHQVMDIFCQDHKLNLSPYYFKPGFAFGGSCLPKDVRAITYLAKSMDIATPTLNAILPSNEQQLRTAIRAVMAFGKKRIGIYGLSFKAGTDDLRESPTVLLAEYLLGKGYDLRVYDRNVNLSKLFGANREFIEREIPHIERLLTRSLDEFLHFAEIVVVCQCPPDEETFRFEGKTVVDFVRMPSEARNGDYYGLCW
jgi:GDP-mannose 6-dehydrogenase